MPDPAIPEPDEVTLADIVRTLWARRVAVLLVFLVVVGAGVAYTFLKSPDYTARATIVAIEQQDVIQRWLESAQAGDFVVQRVAGLPEDLQADAEAGQSLGEVLADKVRLTPVTSVGGRIDRTIHIDVTVGDPVLARDAANAYLASLEVIRPQLQNVTESALFAQFYDGQNAADARRQAHEVAIEREYWIVIDPATVPTRAASPNVQLNIALSVVLGLMLGVVAAFVWEWAAKYRLSARAPVVPPAPVRAAGAPDPGSKYRYRAP